MERKLIAVAVSSALALPMAAHAVEGSVSGHVNRAIIHVDGTGDEAIDGELQHVDSNASQSRFRFTGSEDLGNGTTAGVQLEYGLSTNVRHANVYLSGGFGKLTIGQASTATDGMAHADLGGASWLGGVTNWCAYYSDSNAACPSNDGGRKEVLRYDTPALGPASIAVSSGNDDYWDVKATIAGSMGDGFGYDLRIGHIAEYADDTAGDVTTVSAALSFGQGTSIAVAWSQEDTGTQVEYQYLKLDHSYGDGSVGVYFKLGEHGADNSDGTVEAGDEGGLWGVGVGHNLGGGATAYAGYRRQVSEDRAGVELDDVDLMLAGMRVTFN